MAKFGYGCKCGWHLHRSGLTRKQYADKKVAHAVGHESFVDKGGNEVPAIPGCPFLHEELSVTKPVPARIKAV
jgi:hypothetical protein